MHVSDYLNDVVTKEEQDIETSKEHAIGLVSYKALSLNVKLLSSACCQGYVSTTQNDCQR